MRPTWDSRAWKSFAFCLPTHLEKRHLTNTGNLQALDGGFMILKQKSKLKPTHSITEAQRRPKSASEQYFMNFSRTSNRNGQTTVAEKKGNITNQPTVYVEDRNQFAQVLGRKDKVNFCTNGHVSPDDPNARKDALLKTYLTNEGEWIKKNGVHFEDTALKEKKPSIPLCIEDEIEKPNAKVIRAGCRREKCHSPVKMSESFPVFCHNEGYVEKYGLNRWLSLYADKVFYDVNKSEEVRMHQNTILQNNYNESIAILGSKPCPPSNVTAKRKKKPTLSGKPKHITIQILSVESAPCDVPASSQKQTLFVPKMGGSITRTTSRHRVPERNIQRNMPKCNKDILIVYGVNPNSTIYHNNSSRGLISGIKYQLPDFFDKPLTSVEESQGKGRIIVLDYLPISKPIPVYRSGGELLGHDLSLSPHNSPAIDSCIKIEPSKGNCSEENHQDASDKKKFLDENRPIDTEFTAQNYLSRVQGRSKRIGRLTSSLRCFQEVNKSFGAQKSGIFTPHLIQGVTSIYSPVISIPTAQFEAYETHRDQSVQKPNT